MSDCKDVISVEDDSRIARLITSALEPEGYRVRHCEDGLEALQEVEAQEPALLLVDLMLPRMDGTEFVRELRRRGKTTPVVLVSAVPDLPRRAARLPVQAYVPKPFDVAELVTTVNSLATGD
jgi:DNA-binding response OmpR family regulator